MSETDHLIERFFTMWNEREMELADELFLPNFRAAPIAYEGSWQGEGPESMKHHLMSWLLGMPDLRMQELRRVSEGERVASHWEMVGTHKGVLYGVAGTGLRLRASGVTLFEVREGHIVELRTCFDALGFLQQLGALPDTASLLANIANSSRP